MWRTPNPHGVFSAARIVVEAFWAMYLTHFGIVNGLYLGSAIKEMM